MSTEDKTEAFSAKDTLALPRNQDFTKKFLAFREELLKYKFLEKEKILKELISINNKVKLTAEGNGPDALEIYADLFSQIQALRDRATEIQVRAGEEFDFVDKGFESLFAIWRNYSTAKSQDRRESEAEEILYFVKDFRLRTKAVFDHATNVIYNLNRKQDALKEKVKVLMQAYRVTGDPDSFVDQRAAQQIAGRKKEKRNEQPEKSKDSLNWDQI